MHAARVLNSQRKKREEKNQRRLSTVGNRSLSRSPVPSVDLGIAHRTRKKSRGVDFGCAGLTLTLFGCVPLLVGTFINIPGLFEVGLGLTLIGVFIGVIYLCGSCCANRAERKLIKLDLEANKGRRESRPQSTISKTSRSGSKSRPSPLPSGKVEDMSSLKPTTFVQGKDNLSRTPSTKSITPTHNLTSLTPMTPIPIDPMDSQSNVDVKDGLPNANLNKGHSQSLILVNPEKNQSPKDSKDPKDQVVLQQRPTSKSTSVLTPLEISEPQKPPISNQVEAKPNV